MLRSILLLLLALILGGPALAGTPNSTDFAAIARVAEQEIAARNIPGAVIVIGRRDRTLYRKAFGRRLLGAHPVPMTADTIFDIASLTKVVATTTAVMHLADAGAIDLAAPVSRYWPEFGQSGKEAITVGDLLTHHSGLPADLDLSRPWSGYDTAMTMILAARPRMPPGAAYLYSDINFEILGEIVRRVSGSPLDRYCHDHIFAPLGMKDSFFRPPPARLGRIAPTAGTSGASYRGVAHDATARRMGGVAGHAGLFSSADDLALFARMLLGEGARIPSGESIARMTTRQSPPASPRARGYGWDLGGPGGFPAFPAGSYGHLGFTGTMLWLQPDADLYAIVLTHRVYPSGRGTADPLRRAVVRILDEAIRRPDYRPDER